MANDKEIPWQLRGSTMLNIGGEFKHGMDMKMGFCGAHVNPER